MRPNNASSTVTRDQSRGKRVTFLTQRESVVKKMASKIPANTASQTWIESQIPATRSPTPKSSPTVVNKRLIKCASDVATELRWSETFGISFLNKARDLERPGGIMYSY